MVVVVTLVVMLVVVVTVIAGSLLYTCEQVPVVGPWVGSWVMVR